MSRERVAAQAGLLRRVDHAREDLDRMASAPDADAEANLEHADRELGRLEGELRSELDPEQPPLTRRLPWKRVALVAGTIFLVAMVTITAFEVLTGRAVSTYTGGSDRDTPATVPGVRERDRQPDPTPTEPAETPAETTTGTPEPTPTETPEPSVAPETALPEETPAPSITEPPAP